MSATKLPIASIPIDGGTQPRAVMDYDAIDDYTDSMKDEGAQFPPVVVFYDGTNYWLADGFHRCSAAFAAELDEIECDIRQGTLEDAQWYSFSANKTNGLRRTNEYKQRAVQAALKHPLSKGLSDSKIAEHVGVAVSTVGDWRKKLEPSLGNLKKRKVTRKGKTYEQDTTNIGRKKSAAVTIDITPEPEPIVVTVTDHKPAESEPIVVKVTTVEAQPEPAAAPVQVESDALWLWGRLKDFDRRGILLQEPREVMEGLWDSARADVARIIPKLIAWLDKFAEVMQGGAHG
jgi:transposase-like protein